MNLKIKIVLIFGVFLPYLLQAQSLSDLEKQLDSLINPTEIRNIQIKLAGGYFKKAQTEYRQKNYKDATTAIEKSMEYSKKLKHKEGEAQCLNILGNIFQGKKEYEKALDFYKKSISIKEKLGDESSLASAYNNIGVLYKNLNRKQEALDFYIKSVKIKEKQTDQTNLENSYLNIANLFYEVKNYPKAIEYFGKTAVQQNKNKKAKEAAQSYRMIAQANIKLKKYGAGMSNYQKALKIYKETNDEENEKIIKERIKEVSNFIASIPKDSLNKPDGIKSKPDLVLDDSKLNDSVENKKTNSKKTIIVTDEDIEAVEKTLKEFEDENPELRAMGEELQKLEIDEIKQKEEIEKFKENLPIDPEDVKKVIEEVEQKAEEAEKEGKVDDIVENYTKAEILYEQQGDFKKALEVSKRRLTLLDSLDQYKSELLAEKSKREVAILQAKSENDKQMRTFLWFGSVLFLLLIFFYYRFYSKKKANVILEEINKSLQREKQRSDELLLNILPEETAMELKEHGKAKAKSYKMVTVLFIDFKGFTKIAEKLSPEQLVQELDFCFQAFDRITLKYKIEKIKTIGDAYMCAGGLPGKNTSNPTDIVKAAIEMQVFMQRIKEKKQNLKQPFFEARMGIHTGPVIAGIVGIKKFAYDVWGDTVNIAARMEQTSEAGRINISGETYEYIKHNFKCDYRGKIEAKNKGLIDMYFLEDDYVINRLFEESITV